MGQSAHGVLSSLEAEAGGPFDFEFDLGCIVEGVA